MICYLCRKDMLMDEFSNHTCNSSEEALPTFEQVQKEPQYRPRLQLSELSPKERVKAEKKKQAKIRVWNESKQISEKGKLFPLVYRKAKWFKEGASL